MHDLERRLDRLAPAAPGDLPPALRGALRATRVRRRLRGAGAAAACVVVLAAAGAIIFTISTAPSAGAPRERIVVSGAAAGSPFTLASLTRDNRDLDFAELRLPPAPRGRAAGPVSLAEAFR